MDRQETGDGLVLERFGPLAVLAVDPDPVESRVRRLLNEIGRGVPDVQAGGHLALSQSGQYSILAHDLPHRVSIQRSFRHPAPLRSRQQRRASAGAPSYPEERGDENEEVPSS